MNPFKYINSLPLFGSEDGYKPGLERIERLLTHLGNPEQDLKVIHIAGTNGKGSTAAILERIYRDAGYKTGLYTSPHIFHFNERMKINGQAITSTELAELIEELKKASKKLEQENLGKASFFEVVTALAFKFFSRHQAELVILETGLGGRLDATNVVQSPLLSIITNISLEHSQFLGDNLAEIAAEKGGIIKKDSKIITSVSQKEALETIEKIAKKEGAKFIDLKKEYELIESRGTLTKNIIHLKRNNLPAVDYKISLLGKHQAFNSALALRSVEELQEEFPVAEKKLKKSLKNVYWPGRMQKVLEKPAVILDAAHNPAAFKEILSTLANSKSEYKNLHFVFSVLEDKDLDAIFKEFLETDLKADFYLAANSSFRTMSTAKLKEKADHYQLTNYSYPNLSQAADAAYDNAAEDDIIIVAGSFNTVFEAGISFMTKKPRGEKNE